MIHLLRLLSRLTILGGLTWFAVIWAMQQSALPPQIQTPITGHIDYIIVEKSARRMTLYQDGQAVRFYKIALGFTPAGDKIREGDGKTPEGLFKINRRNQNSAYTLSLGIDYPQADDLKRARESGYSAGGDIFIHGQPNNLPDLQYISGDWTAGCIALTNAEIREVWRVVPMGTSVEIKS